MEGVEKLAILIMKTSFFERINQYRSMWVMVLFDLPTDTKKDRSIATKFRKTLLKDGFGMFQFSIYTRFCASRENAEVHIKRVKMSLPAKGEVCIMHITDRQFGMMEIFRSAKEIPTEPPSQQLEIF